MTLARELWKRIEVIHAVTYFAPESIAGARDAGLKGFWMGYFGFRAAPLGSVPASVVQATFANFAPAMVERAVPDAWDFATPAGLVDVRARTAAAALRRINPAIDTAIDAASEAGGARRLTQLAEVVNAAETMARPLFAANASLPSRPDPVEQLWQWCTTLREHRGDGHVATLAVESIDGCEAHRLHAAANDTPDQILRDNRGFSIDEWDGAGSRLARRGLMTTHGELTEAGSQLVDRVERHTDRLAAVPFDRVLVESAQYELLEWLDAIARPVATSGVLPFPNPMGLPQLGD